MSDLDDGEKPNASTFELWIKVDTLRERRNPQEMIMGTLVPG
jgi:hypothetical protein